MISSKSKFESAMKRAEAVTKETPVEDVIAILADCVYLTKMWRTLVVMTLGRNSSMSIPVVTQHMRAIEKSTKKPLGSAAIMRALNGEDED